MHSGRCVAAVLMGLLLLCVCHISSAVAEEQPTPRNLAPGIHVSAITVKGVERSYLLHVPSSYKHAKKWPVVVMFHGGGGTAKSAMWETGWAEKSNKNGFLTVFPEGTRPDPSRPARFRDNPQTWNDGSRRPNVGAARREVPDVEFISRMLADLRMRFSIDERRIYATGFSNGASMTFRVARELSPIIAAVAPVAGSDWLENRKPQSPVPPLLYITGTADPLNPLEGGEIRIGEETFGSKPVTHEMIGKWVTILGCPEEARVVCDKDGVTGIAYGLSGEKALVLLYTIEGQGHHWPGGKSALPVRLAGKNTVKLNATDVIWDFFKGHSKVDRHDAQPDAPADAGKPRR